MDNFMIDLMLLVAMSFFLFSAVCNAYERSERHRDS